VTQKTLFFPDFQTSDAASFDQLLAVNIRKLQEFVSSLPRLAVYADRLTFDADETSGCDVRWHFIACNIQLLQLLCKHLSEVTEKCDSLSGNASGCRGTNPEMSAPPLAANTLSLAHRKVISSALQFIAGLGICPLLMPGVGIPLHRRSELAWRLVAETDAASCFSNCVKYHRLMLCIDALLDCLELQALSSIILSANLCDLLASLIQICYAPDWKTYATECEKTRCSRKELGLFCHHKNYMDELRKLMNQVSSSALVRELLLLQSGCPPTPIMKVCAFIVVIFCSFFMFLH